jgi:hypothetical protein
MESINRTVMNNKTLWPTPHINHKGRGGSQRLLLAIGFSTADRNAANENPYGLYPNRCTQLPAVLYLQINGLINNLAKKYLI